MIKTYNYYIIKIIITLIKGQWHKNLSRVVLKWRS